MIIQKHVCMSLGMRATCFFDHGNFGPRGWHRQDPDVKIRRSKGLNPSFHVVVHGDFKQKTIEKHNSKQIEVYEQNTSFIKKNTCFSNIFVGSTNLFSDWKNEFWIKTTRNWNWNEPELERTGTDRTETETEPNRTGAILDFTDQRIGRGSALFG